MSERTKDPEIDLGIYARPRSGSRLGLGPTGVIAAGLSLVWLVGAGAFFLVFGTGDGSGGALVVAMVVLALFLPIAMIWVVAMVADSARTMREESRRLEASIGAMRHLAVTQAQSTSTAARIPPSVERKLAEIVEAQKKTETALATFTSTRQVEERRVDAPVAVTTDAEGQVSLELGTPAPTGIVSVADYIRALNFPETAEDRDGFAALRRALTDPRAARLIQSAQDVLTLMSQDGIYMDDLPPDRARPELWRRFAQGERGRPIAALGGIRDRASLALASARMRQDTIFRDTAHHFLRMFDSAFAEFEPAATDAEIVALTDTRTARAFMLLGRATGIFD